METMEQKLVTIDQIMQARERLPSAIVHTPLLVSEELSNRLHKSVYLKCESLQITGSYKPRAAYTVLASLDPAARRRGAVLASSGNFAAAFAYMGRLLGIPTAVVMMRKTAEYKVERARRLGAEVVFCEDRWEAREEVLNRLESERGLTVIHHLEDPHVIAGHGTIGLEIMEDCPEAGLVLVTISSGGLIAGAAAAVKGRRPAARGIGWQPVGAAAMGRAREA